MTNLHLPEIQERLRNGSLTVLELCKAYLTRAKEISAHNAYIEIYEEDLLVTAAALDQKIKEQPDKLGPLFGAVISIKDNLCYKNHKVSAGSKMLSDYVSPYNATVVERLLAADALIIGRTNCDEFSMGSTSESSHYGPVKNAIDSTKVPGGSSGGGAVAVALNSCLISIGSDTGGSVRQPGAFNGIMAYKPSYGAIPRWGLLAYGSSLDAIGLMGHSIKDMQTVIAAVAGPDDYDSTAIRPALNFSDSSENTIPGQTKIAYSSALLNHELVSQPVRQSAEAHLSALRKQGYTLVDIELDFVDFLVPCYYILATAEASSNLSRYDGIRYGHRSAEPAPDYKTLMKNSRSEGFGLEVQKRIMMGTYVLSEGYYDAFYGKAMEVRAMIRDKMEKLFEEHDFLLLPTTTVEPWALGEETEDPLAHYFSDLFTVLANICGIPAISYPIENLSGSGLLLGMQLMCGQQEDGKLLGVVERLSR